MIPTTTRKNSAVIAAVALLLMAIIAPIANFAILQGLIVPDDAAATLKNIMASESSFRLAILIFVIVVLLDILVAWALYIFLKPIQKSLSLLTAWIRIVYAAMLAVLLVHLIDVLELIGNASYLQTFDSAQIEALVMLSLKSFSQGWEFSLLIFGFHLVLLGYLILKAGYMKNVLGILVILAGAGYCMDGIGRLLSADYNLTISMYTFIGEVVVIFWLLIGGRKVAE